MKTNMPLRVALAVLWAGAAAWPAAAQQRLSPRAQAQLDAQQAAPTRPQNGEAPTKPIDLNFVDVDLQNVVEMLGAQIGKNFLLPSTQMNQKVTIFSHHPVPPELAYEALESLLAAYNFSLVDTLDGNLVKIVPAGGSPERLDIQKGKVPPEAGFDSYAIRIVNVEFATASEVADLLKTVGTQDGGSEISVWNSTNTLIIRDTAEAMRNMLQLLEVIDVPGNQVIMDIFILQFERAETILQYLQDVLTDEGGGPATGARSPVTARPAPTRVQRNLIPGRTAPTQVGSREEVLRMVPNERLNALIVVASEPLMVQVRDLIDQIDTPTPYEENTIHYVELRNADAEEVAAALEGLTGLATRQGSEGGGAAGGQTAQVQPFEKEISITHYEPTNSLIIVATPQDYRRLELLISNIDVPIRQVNVEAIIMEVSITDRFELGVELLGLTGSDAFGLNNVANLTNAILGGPLALAGPGATLGILDGTTQIPVPGLPDANGFPSGLGLQTIPNVPLLLRALETVTDVEVLSQPNIMTRDNEESEITVGQEIPLVSSLQDNFRGGQQTGFQGFAGRGSIRRQKVGVIMKVTPQINEGDYVSMEILVEVSEPVESTVGISEQSQGGATINLTEVSNHVVIPDGSTGIIGGLLKESKNRTVFGAPGLSDIPLLGWLFRNKVNARRKQNLVILLTPHIIKEAQDLERVTEFRVAEFYQRNIDVIFESGMFFKKLRKKHEVRSKYNPTQRFNNPKGVRRGFSRGRIER